MQQSGGLLPAGQDPGGTFIFRKAENANESPAGHQRTQIRTLHIVRNVFALEVIIPAKP